MDIYGIPSSAANQSFQLSIDSITYIFRLKWNPISAHWLVDILSPSGTPLSCAIPLLSGVDCIGHCHFIGIDGEIRLSTDDDTVPAGEYVICYVKK